MVCNLVLSCTLPYLKDKKITGIQSFLYPDTPDLAWTEYFKAESSFKYIVDNVDQYIITGIKHENAEVFIYHHSIPEITHYISTEQSHYIDHIFSIIKENKVKHTIDLNTLDKTCNRVVWDTDVHTIISRNAHLIIDQLPRALKSYKNTKKHR